MSFFGIILTNLNLVADADAVATGYGFKTLALQAVEDAVPKFSRALCIAVAHKVLSFWNALSIGDAVAVGFVEVVLNLCAVKSDTVFHALIVYVLQRELAFGVLRIHKMI